MPKKLVTLSVLFFFLVLASQVLAGETASKTTGKVTSKTTNKTKTQETRKFHWNDKLKRGALNIITCPVELVRQFHLAGSEEGESAKHILLIIPAFGKVFLRLGAGFIELLTFPLDFPTAGKTPLVEPEYVWDSDY